MAKRKTNKTRRQKLPEGMMMDEVPSPLGNGMDQVMRRMDIDSLEWMYRHHDLTEAQYQAGQRYHTAYLVYSAQQNLAIDYAKERVDTSGVQEPLTDAQMRAADTVKQATKEIGYIRAYRMQKIAGEGWFAKDFARLVHGLVARRAVDRITKEWKDDLDTLARLWGIDAKHRNGGIRSWQAA